MKQVITRLALLLFGFSLIFGLSACSGGGGSSGAAEDPATGSEWDKMEWEKGKWK